MGSVNLNDILNVLETTIKVWEHTIFFIEDLVFQKRYLMDLD